MGTNQIFQTVMSAFFALSAIGIVLAMASLIKTGHNTEYRSKLFGLYYFGAMLLSTGILSGIAYSKAIYIPKSTLDQAASGVISNVALSLLIFFIIYWLYGRNKDSSDRR